MRHECYMELVTTLRDLGYEPSGLVTSTDGEQLGFLYRRQGASRPVYALLSLCKDKIIYKFDPDAPGFHIHRDY